MIITETDHDLEIIHKNAFPASEVVRLRMSELKEKKHGGNENHQIDREKRMLFHD